MSNLGLNVAKKYSSLHSFYFFATFYPKLDICYLQKINYDSRIFQVFRVRVG